METKALCRRWLEGQRLALWNQVPDGKPNKKTSPGKDEEEQEAIVAARHKRALTLASMGLPKKACAALVSRSPADPSPEVLQEMRDKHPTPWGGIRWGDLRPVHAAAAVAFDDEAVRDAIRSFPRDSAGGPSGLRPQHLRDAMVPGFEDELVRQLSALANMMARGEAPEAARPFLCGATLTALPKEDGIQRPVAVGEVLRRLVGKCLAQAVREDARKLFEPLQVGVGTPGGCEAVPHVCRKWFGLHAGDVNRVLAQVDMENSIV
mgnify:CR=1 FL=1